MDETFPLPKKRKNTNKIGNEAELIAKEHLERQGYLVHRAARAYRPVGNGQLVNVQTDVFGCIDLVAKKKNHATLWIQVTVDGGIGRKMKDLQKVPWNLDDIVQVWQWKKRSMRECETRAEYQKWLHFRVIEIDHLTDDKEFAEKAKVFPLESNKSSKASGGAPNT